MPVFLHSQAFFSTCIMHSCTSCLNVELEAKYLTKTDVQLNPNILRTKNDEGTIKSTRIMNVPWLWWDIILLTNQ